MDDKKVLLLRGRDFWLPPEETVIHVKASPAFFYSPAASRAHRVRSGRLFVWQGRTTHAAYSLWCGQHGLISEKHKGNRLTNYPPRTLPVCATCEGRARGAGQLESHEIAGRLVLFSPR